MGSKVCVDLALDRYHEEARMSLDGKARSALSVVLHHDRDALVNRLREENERLRSAAKNRLLRTVLNLLDAAKKQHSRYSQEDFASVEYAKVAVNDEMIERFYRLRGETEVPDEVAQIPLAEKFAIIPHLCDFGYHVLEIPQTDGSFMIAVPMATLTREEMQTHYDDDMVPRHRQHNKVVPVLHLASPIPMADLSSHLESMPQAADPPAPPAGQAHLAMLAQQLSQLPPDQRRALIQAFVEVYQDATAPTTTTTRAA